GLADPHSDELVVRGDLDARDFTAFWLRNGRVEAAMNVNQWDDGDALQAMVDRRVSGTAEGLRTADLAELAQRGAARPGARAGRGSGQAERRGGRLGVGGLCAGGR